MFKNFKTLKSHPQKESGSFLSVGEQPNQRYNQLRVACGLEKPGDEPEDNDGPLHDDCIFKGMATTDNEKQILVLAVCGRRKDKEQVGVFASQVAETTSGDFAECIEAILHPSYAQEIVLAISF